MRPRQAVDTRARLRRMRWTLTLLFTLTTAACLITLAAIATHIDAASRRRALDNDLDRRATGLSRAVWIENKALHLEPLSEDPLVPGPGAIVVVEVAGGRGVRQRWTGGDVDLRPRQAEALELASVVARTEETGLDDARTDEGVRVRLGAAPVWGDTEVGAVVLVAGDPAPSTAAHRALVRWLFGGCLALASAAGVSGYLLSGRSIRPALRSMEWQERFLADASHEIRTPLSTLRLTVEAGLRSPERAEESLRHAVRLSDELGRLVAGLLARARVRGGTQEVERIPLRLDLVVEQVLADLPDPVAEISLSADPCVVRGDPDLVALAVRNLVLNALQHGGGTGDPRVEITVTDGVVTVRDHGRGLPPATRRRVRRRGATGASREASPTRGNGLGLAIVDWAAKLHGGGVDLRAAAGGGALAELDLRAAVLHDAFTRAPAESVPR